MADPFNCPVCGAHDYGLFASAMVGCPHCMQARIAALEASLSFKSSQVDRIVIEEAAATKAAKDRAKKAEDALATCRAQAKAEGIMEAAAVCRKEKGKWMQLSHEEDQCERCEKAILALLPPASPEAQKGRQA